MTNIPVAVIDLVKHLPRPLSRLSADAFCVWQIQQN
jgi:hypothetical protein